MNERKMLVWIWTLIVIAVAFIVWLAWTDRAEAHLAYEGTSDGPDPGLTIELYKPPGTHFEGRFARAREHFNRIGGVPEFVMVRDVALAEVFVWKGTRLDCWEESICDAHMLKHPFPLKHELMVIDTIHGERLESVFEHELGHVLDLEHHPCDDYTSVMNECADVSRITSHDRMALKQSPHY